MIYVASSGATNAVLQWLPHIMSSRCKRYGLTALHLITKMLVSAGRALGSIMAAGTV